MVSAGGRGTPGGVTAQAARSWRRSAATAWRAVFAASATLVIAAAKAPREARAHPLHTTLAELSCTPGAGVEIVLRAFVDDFSAAVAGARAGGAAPGPATPSDSAAARYLARVFSLADASGRTVRLEVAGVRRAGDLVWVTMRAPGMRSLAGARLTNRVLFERYDDQVNIVQATVAGRRETLLFTRKDAGVGKRL